MQGGQAQSGAQGPAGPIRAAIGLGSNVGDRAAHIRFALWSMAALPGTVVLRASDVIETAPVGPIPQGPYLNACALLETALEPGALLAHLQAIERARGRDRASEARWGPRTLDLDILLYGNWTVSRAGLTIPHPRLLERRFVLAPLSQIAPDMLVPGQNRTVSQSLSLLPEGGLCETPGPVTGTMSP